MRNRKGAIWLEPEEQGSTMEGKAEREAKTSNVDTDGSR